MRTKWNQAGWGSKIVAAAAIALAGLCGEASAALVDDFSGDLTPYTLSRVNDGNTAGNIAFSTADGTLRSSYGGANAFEQVLLLRDDFTLPVGQVLFADVVGWAAGTNYDRDLGIAVGFTETPTSLGAASGDVRTSFVEVAVRGNNQVVSFARDDAGNLTSGQVFTGSGTPALTTTDPLQLFISRTSASTFDVGYFQNNVARTIQTYTFTAPGDVPGAAVGLYTDLRAALTSTPIGIDNLQIASAVPEPASLGLLALAGLAAARRWRA